MKGKNKKRENKLIISEEIDSTIGGVAVGLSYISVAILVTLNKNYLNNEIAITIIRWVFLLFGTPIALACTLSKAKCDSNRLATGFFIGGIWFLLFTYIDWLWVRISSLLLLFVSVFLILQELLFISYSIIGSVKTDNANENYETIKKTNSIFAFIVTILGLVLVALQILQQLEVL